MTNNNTIGKDTLGLDFYGKREWHASLYSDPVSEWGENVW